MLLTSLTISNYFLQLTNTCNYILISNYQSFPSLKGLAQGSANTKMSPTHILLYSTLL